MVLISLTTSSSPSARKSRRATPRSETRAADPLRRGAQRRLERRVDGRRQLAGGRGHALAAHVLVGVAQDLGLAGRPAGPRRAQRPLDRRQRQRGPRPQPDLQVDGPGPERLEHRTGPQVLVGRQPGLRRGQVGHHLDADRRAAEAGLDDVGALEVDPDRVGRRASTRGSVAQPGRLHHRPEGQLVHARSPPRRRWGRCSGARPGRGPPAACRPRRGRRGSRPRPRRRRAGGPVRSGHRRPRSPPSAPSTRRSGVAPAGQPVDEGARLEGRVDLEPVTRLGPVEGPDGPGPTTPARGRPGAR